MAERDMKLSTIWLTFDGRISRSVYWLWFVLPSLAIMIVANVLDYMLGFAAAGGAGVGYIGLAVSLALLWPSIATAAKRLHDRDMSGWWQLVCLIPIVGLFFWLIVIGCLKGTEGDNRFGADPVGGGAPAFA